MIYVDNLLLQVINHTTPSVYEVITPRDSRVLQSLASSIDSPSFITENQANLLVKILRENAKRLTHIGQDLDTALSAPIWSRPFRKIDQVKKLYIAPIQGEHEMSIFIEFTFNAQLRKMLVTRSKSIENLNLASSKVATADLTEQNIVLLVEMLTPFGFEIDIMLKQHYDTIKSWNRDDFENQFLITNIPNQNFQKQITADLGEETPIDESIINDRSMRYQYFTKIPKIPGETLTSKIANRATSRVWVDSNTVTLSDVVKSLIELKRLPLMISFDHRDNADTLKNLKKVHEALAENNVTDHVGIYFRLPSIGPGKDFNDIIAQNLYNKALDDTTKIVGVSSGKLPKFFISTNWRPMSVLSINSHLRANKTAVFANCCDLVISYTATQPIIEKF